MALKHEVTPVGTKVWAMAAPAPMRRAAALAANPSLAVIVRRIEQDPAMIRNVSIETVAEAVELLSPSTLQAVLTFEKRTKAWVYLEVAARAAVNSQDQTPDSTAQPVTSAQQFRLSKIAQATETLLDSPTADIVDKLDDDKAPARYDMNTVCQWLLDADSDTFADVAPSVLEYRKWPMKYSRALLERALKKDLPSLYSPPTIPKYHALADALTRIWPDNKRPDTDVDAFVDELGGIDWFTADLLVRRAGTSFTDMFTRAHPVDSDAAERLLQGHMWPLLVTLRAISIDQAVDAMSATPYDRVESAMLTLFNHVAFASSDPCEQTTSTELVGFVEALVPALARRVDDTRHLWQGNQPYRGLSYTSYGGCERVFGVALRITGLSDATVSTCLRYTSPMCMFDFLEGVFPYAITTDHLKAIAGRLGEGSATPINVGSLATKPHLLDGRFGEFVFELTANIFQDAFQTSHAHLAGSTSVVEFVMRRVCSEVEMTQTRWDQFFTLLPTFTGTGRDMVDVLRMF
jgi:hypothetical protein